jgi:hypothetical protein
MTLQKSTNLGHDFPKPLGEGASRFAARLLPHLAAIAVINNDPKFLHVIARVAMEQGTRSGSIAGHHASDCALDATRRIRRKASTDLGQTPIQFTVNHARLHADGVRANLQNGPKMAAQVNNEPVAQSFARQAGTGAAGNEREVMLGRIAN